MLSRLVRLTHRNVQDWNDAQAISAEIFGAVRFQQHARSLAASQSVSDRPRKVRSIVQRLGDNSAALLEAYRDICAAIADGKAVTPASEWLIDNYHLVEEHVRQTQADLPEGFYRQLPKLSDGPLAGHPRIFGLVWAYVAHTDSRFDPESLTDFVSEYQTVQPLTIGELWAVAISLRLILIENLRRIADRMRIARTARAAADALAERILAIGEAESRPLFEKAEEPDVSQPFVVQLVQRLRDHDGAALEALDWLKRKTDALGYSIEEAVNNEHHRQAAANVTVRNIVTSLRLVSDVNWESWFDSVSLVDQLLRRHETYAGMDFASRTTYRTAVEELSRGSGHAELDIAGRALERCRCRSWLSPHWPRSPRTGEGDCIQAAAVAKNPYGRAARRARRLSRRHSRSGGALDGRRHRRCHCSNLAGATTNPTCSSCPFASLGSQRRDREFYPNTIA